jgi:hypothetical protein
MGQTVAQKASTDRKQLKKLILAARRATAEKRPLSCTSKTYIRCFLNFMMSINMALYFFEVR